MATESPSRRIEKTFAISIEADAFLQSLWRRSQAESESDVLEGVLKEAMAAEKLRAIDAAYKRHYDSFSENDIEEERAWGAFAESQLAAAAVLDEEP